MSEEISGREACRVCGKSSDGDAGFTYLHHNGVRVALCCPLCVQLFQRSPERFLSGDRCKTLIEELLDEMKWKDLNR